MSNMMEQSIGRTLPATFLSAARQGIFFIPMLFLLEGTIGLTGLLMTQAASDLLTLLCAIPIHIYVLKSVKKEQKNLPQ